MFLRGTIQIYCLGNKVRISYHLYTASLKKKTDTNELIYETESDAQTSNTNLWLPKGKGWGQIRSLGLIDTYYQT